MEEIEVNYNTKRYWLLAYATSGSKVDDARAVNTRDTTSRRQTQAGLGSLWVTPFQIIFPYCDISSNLSVEYSQITSGCVSWCYSTMT